jgi:hypothetical protein
VLGNETKALTWEDLVEGRGHGIETTMTNTVGKIDKWIANLPPG